MTKKRARDSFRGAAPILLMLLTWGLGIWVWYNVATAYGWTQSSPHLRSGTMNVTACHRAPTFAFVLYACKGEVRLAPESTWQGVAPEKLRKRPITLLSRTALHGETDFFTFMPSGLNSRRWSIPDRWWGYGTWQRKTYEIAMPTAQEVTALTWAVFWPPFVTGIGFLIGGVLIAIGAYRFLNPRTQPR